MIANNIEDLVKEVAIQEVLNPTWGAVEEYLKVLKIKTVDGVPQIEHVECTSAEGYTVYFPIESERFYLKIFVDASNNEVKVGGSYVYSGSRVYLYVDSQERSESDLLSNCAIKPSKSWDKGSRRFVGKRPTPMYHKDSGINLEPDSNLYVSAETKTRNLLASLERTDFLEKIQPYDDSIIVIVMYCYYGNGNIDFISFEQEIVAAAGKLGLSIEFDVYVSGEPFGS